MVKSELGQIPRGWIARPFGETLGGHIGGGWGKDVADSKNSEPAFVIRGTDIPAARSMNVEKCPLRWHPPSNLRSRRLQPDDIVMEVSGGSTDQAVGRALLVSSNLLRSFGEDVICASFCKRLAVNNGRIMPMLAYMHLQELYSSGRISEYEVQSTGIKNFKFAVFLGKELILCAPRMIQLHYMELVQPMLDFSQNLGARNQFLLKTQELLLPKLISGELSVEAVDEQFADVAGA